MNHDPVERRTVTATEPPTQIEAPVGAESLGTGPPRLALRTPLEMYLWIFVTRLVAILLTPRSAAISDPAPVEAPAAAAASAPTMATPSRTPSPAGSATNASRRVRTGTAGRASGAVALTSATAAAAVAAFALGRRRASR